LNKLEEFEKSQKYIQKNVSLKTLAQQFDTNPKYLSEIVNNHKNSNFNTYINNLRIDYIVEKIKKNPEYRKYKVSYLADECGFSSHSLFTTIFKNRMDLSPTEFLQKLNE
jgi:YesN/AraC family two-component response regulator